MKKDTEKTKVIFRYWKTSKDVVAIFPELPGTNDPDTCGSYEHVGQHSACDPLGIVRDSRPAIKEEYNDLFIELENHCGYNLDIILRNKPCYIETRRKTIKEVV